MKRSTLTHSIGCRWDYGCVFGNIYLVYSMVVSKKEKNIPLFIWMLKSSSRFDMYLFWNNIQHVPNLVQTIVSKNMLDQSWTNLDQNFYRYSFWLILLKQLFCNMKRSTLTLFYWMLVGLWVWLVLATLHTAKNGPVCSDIWKLT